MSEIRIESKPVSFTTYDHLYLVFRDDDGIETVIRGGPANNNPLDFGNIFTEFGVPIEDSRDARETLTPEARNSTVIDLGGRDANSVWQIMLQQAQNIGNANLNYNALFGVQNSNSTIASVLNSVGIDINSNLPTGTFASTFPGINNLLDFDTNLTGTSDDDTIRGGASNDTLTGNGGNDIINGGEGLDTSIYSGSFDDYQIELSPGGIARITDNIENRDGSDRLIGIEIVEFSDRSIDLRDGDVLLPPAPYAEEAEDGFGQAEQAGSPLVLDLDGDGIELTAVDSPTVYFDIDGDGLRESTGWVQADDGLLVFDRNNDSYINDNSELFGNTNSFSNGFEALEVLDTNGDNLIDASDTDFANLQVWRDLDSDGRSDVNELYSLSELNIKNIELNYSNTLVPNAGNQIKQVSSYELTDGTTREIVDAWFTIDQLNSYYDAHSTYNEPLVITEEILNLPNLKGYGNLPDLRIAIAKDAELVSLVESFSNTVASGDISGSRDLIIPILYQIRF